MERRSNDSARSHLGPFGAVDTVCTMGTVPASAATISTTIQSSHSRWRARGLFCAQLLARVLDPLAKTAIPRHLAAHFVHAMNDGGVIPTAKRLTDLHQLHFQ